MYLDHKASKEDKQVSQVSIIDGVSVQYVPWRTFIQLQAFLPYNYLEPMVLYKKKKYILDSSYLYNLITMQ